VKKRLADIADVRTGFPFRKAVQPVLGGTLAVVQMKDIDESAGLDLTGLMHIEDEPGRYQQHLLYIGDVLLQSKGNKFPAAALDKPVHGIAALGLMIIRPRLVSPEYLRWILNQPRTRDDLRTAAKGTYVPFLSRAAVETLSVPVPAMETQLRIVEIDRMRNQEQRLVNQLSDLNNQFTDALVWKAATSNSRK
jgi:restriction endonuclease S subunit